MLLAIYVTLIFYPQKLLIITALVACVAADVSHILPRSGEADAKILRQEQDVGLEGQYQWAIETENGISAQESGALKNPQSENAAQTAQGQARWTAPNGEVIELQYTADENGYQAQGSHLPTPPPIPEAILKALEYIRANPPPPERN
ncbi:Larval cuticle protein LCP-17 [Papilio machaon]|uniref:Larval cuticle protein LCP-17 n=1 Tax=Papilio machaon TaxID=76193 RepID=A0A0N1PJL0_PAPMA|nr:Larval cuticle protein LCP-17 [Papilio machaon]